MGDIMRREVETLARRREQIKQMGGEEAAKKHHGRGKLTARERLYLLIEKETFVETGMLGSEFGVDELVPADGVITGYGKLNDGVRIRDVAVAAYDFTVRGGSMGIVNETQVSRIREGALRERIPMIWLNDSGGARVSGGGFSGERGALFADTGYLFKEESLMSGIIPQIAAMMGAGYARPASIA